MASDRAGSGTFAGVARFDAVRETAAVRDHRVAAGTVIAADIEDQALSARAQDRGPSAEVTGQAERLQICGPDAQANPRGRRPPPDPLDHRVDLRTDRGKQRPQLAGSGGRPAELLDHVHRRSHLLLADDLDDHAPRVMAEHGGADSPARHDRQARRLETIHGTAILGYGLIDVQDERAESTKAAAAITPAEVADDSGFLLSTSAASPATDPKVLFRRRARAAAATVVG